jgi:hypothetical protein
MEDSIPRENARFTIAEQTKSKGSWAMSNSRFIWVINYLFTGLNLESGR